MTDWLRPLRVNAVELLRQPGATKRIEAHVPADALGVEHRTLDGDVDVVIGLEALDAGIIVEGTASAPWKSLCRRCLTELSGAAIVELDELYQIEVTDPDAFELENGRLDLVPMVREMLLLELDGERLCGLHCVGLCPHCGADRDDASCRCESDVTDERWAVLDDLVIDDDPASDDRND
jgi:uncharacterized protein